MRVKQTFQGTGEVPLQSAGRMKQELGPSHVWLPVPHWHTKQYNNTFPGAKRTHAYTHIHISQQLIYVQAHRYTYMHMKIHACLLYTSTHMCVHGYICRYGHIQIQTRTHFYIHSHTCMHAYPHIHTHKNQDLQPTPVTALRRGQTTTGRMSSV